MKKIFSYIFIFIFVFLTCYFNVSAISLRNYGGIPGYGYKEMIIFAVNVESNFQIIHGLEAVHFMIIKLLEHVTIVVIIQTQEVMQLPNIIFGI